MNEEVMRDMFHMLCGKELGAGMSRRVYEANTFEDCVVKVESESGRFQNITEWQAWREVEHTDKAKWFAPCKWISPYGTILVQQRTQPLVELPAQMPVFFTDFKRDNFGILDGHVVCHDYGLHRLMTTGLTNRLQKVAWREG